jgi:hypothetical protein
MAMMAVSHPIGSLAWPWFHAVSVSDIDVETDVMVRDHADAVEAWC